MSEPTDTGGGADTAALPPAGLPPSALASSVPDRSASQTAGQSPLQSSGPSAGLLARATGSDDARVQGLLLTQLSAALVEPEGLDEGAALARVEGALALLSAIGPQGGAERLLAVQMVAVHEAAMDCLARAARADVPGGSTLGGGTPGGGTPRRAELALAARLASLYARQTEALARGRRRGEQRVTVEHVHVNAGGRAIVGPVQSGARAPDDGAGGNAPHGATGARRGSAEAAAKAADARHER